MTCYEELREYPDVEFPLDPAPPPDLAHVAAVRTELETLLIEGERMMPSDEPEGGWDKTQNRLRSLVYHMHHGRWNDDRYFLDALADAVGRWDMVQKKWAADQRGKVAAVGLRDRLIKLTETGSAAQDVLDQWWAHRYPTAMRFAKGAADALMAHRRSSGRLDFQDLLDLAARMLRRNPAARSDLGDRWRYLLVDEFPGHRPTPGRSALSAGLGLRGWGGTGPVHSPAPARFSWWAIPNSRSTASGARTSRCTRVCVVASKILVLS